MAETMETEMEFSDSEQTNGNAHIAASQYSAANVYNRSLLAAYGNSPIGLEKRIERRLDHEQQLPGYIFMCNGRTKTDCYRYRVFGIPRGRKDVVESIKPGMKLFLYDFEKRLLYGVYEATIGGKLDIEPEAFDKQYPAQVGFRIVMNCYPLPENTFKSAIFENYKGSKFKQELTPHQVMSLLALFRSFTAPELDSLPHRYASRASAPRTLSFEERFIAATQLRNASSVLDPLSARHADPRLGSLMAHQSLPRTSLLQHSYSRQDNYSTPPRESLSNLNQPFFPTEARQQRLLEDPPRSSIQDPQLKYLTILSNIRRYGTAPERLVSEIENYSATPSEKDQFSSPYSDNKYYPSMLTGNEHPSASAANGSVYRSEFYTSASQKEGEASQQHEISAGAYYHPEASTVPNTAVSMQSDKLAVSAAKYQTDTAGYPTPAHGEASQPAAGAVGYTHQPQSVRGNYTTHSQPGNVEESTQLYSGTVSYPQQQYLAAMGQTTQLYTGGTGYAQQTHAASTGYAQQPDAAATGYTQQTRAAATGYAQQADAAATGYTQQTRASATGYAQQPDAAATAYTQQTHAAATAYTQQPDAAATAYTQQTHAAATAYTQQPHSAVTAYTQQPHGEATAYTQQPHGMETAYTQQPHGASTAYTQQLQAAAAAYAQQSHAAASGYVLQPHAQVVGYTTEPQAQAVGYTPQYYAQAVGYTPQYQAQAVGYTPQYQAQAVGYTPQYQAQAVGYSQQAVTQGSIPGAPGTTDWNAASQAYSATGDWNAVNQSYYPPTANATTTYNQTS